MSTETLVLDIRDWCINRFCELTKEEQVINAIALEEEFSEWLGNGLDSDIEIITID